MFSFSEIEQDATVELVNLGIGRAADALAKLIKEEVHLSVPSIEMIGFEKLGSHLRQIDCRSPTVVMQHFYGSFNGDALLVFPEDCGMHLVRQMLQDTISTENVEGLEDDAILEIGNIILNACFGQLAELLVTRLDCDVPIYIHTNVDGALRKINSITKSENENQTVMLLQVDFAVQSISAVGFIAFIMDSNAIDVFRDKVDIYLKGLFN